MKFLIDSNPSVVKSRMMTCTLSTFFSFLFPFLTEKAIDDAKLSDEYYETALSMIDVFSKLHYLYHNSEESKIFEPEVVFGDWTEYNCFQHIIYRVCVCTIQFANLRACLVELQRLVMEVSCPKSIKKCKTDSQKHFRTVLCLDRKKYILTSKKLICFCGPQSGKPRYIHRRRLEQNHA